MRKLDTTINLMFDVFAGKANQFLHQDANLRQNLSQEPFSEIPTTWNTSNKTLQIGYAWLQGF